MTGLSFSLALGVLLGAIHAVAACVMALRATRQDAGRRPEISTGKAVQLVVGGMVVRMAVVLVLFAAILAALPVERGAFVGSFGATVLAGLLVEGRLLLSLNARRSQPAA